MQEPLFPDYSGVMPNPMSPSHVFHPKTHSVLMKLVGPPSTSALEYSFCILLEITEKNLDGMQNFVLDKVNKVKLLFL